MSRARTIIVVGLFILISSIGVSETLAQGQRIMREPKVVNAKNSQNIELLKGHSNPNYKVSQGARLAVVDENALVDETPHGGSELDDFSVKGSGQISIYVVREGDTLSDIAHMYGVSVNTISWANDIKGGIISPGQELVILPISGVKHTVTSGDTLITISKKYKADIDELMAYNGLTSGSTLSLGDVVIVPDGELTSISSHAASYSSSNSNTAPSGYYGRPLQGGRKTQGIHGHNGVDFGAPVGTPVIASADGTVIVARGSGWNGGYGLYVVVSHSNGTQTLYAHLSTVNITAGETVSKGQTIGTVGSTGKSTGPHLHFEVRGARNPY
ncbi:MAG: peptidoglycan DD-metalloendopeptidase family protein [Minisyncoccota bacterium]